MIRRHDEKLHSTKNHFDNMRSRKKSTVVIGLHDTAAALRNDIESRRVNIESMQARIGILRGAEETLPHLVWGSEATVSFGEGWGIWVEKGSQTYCTLEILGFLCCSEDPEALEGNGWATEGENEKARCRGRDELI